MPDINSQRGHPHAHPAPAPDTKNDYLRIAKHPVEITFQGGVSTDAYFPEVRRSPFVNTYNVNHLDVISCWKNLSASQADEIVMWKRFHREALEKQVTKALRIVIHQELFPPLNNGATFQSRLMDTVSCLNTRSLAIPVEIGRLVHDMSSNLYAAYGSRVGTSSKSQHKFGWVVAQRDLPGMVFNFISTQNYYVEAYPEPYVEVNINHATTSSGFKILCEVKWQPPSVDFLDLPTILKPGEEFRITPSVSPTLSSSTFTMLPYDIDYEASSDKLPIEWDHELYCFKARVPHIDEKPESTETTLSTKLTLMFPDNVRFERTSRYLIKLSIKQPKIPEVTRYNDGCSNTSVQYLPSLPLTPVHDWNWNQLHSQTCLFNKQERPDPTTSQSTVVLRDLPHISTKKPKRKASTPVPSSVMFSGVSAFKSDRLALDQFEHRDLELDTKRQKTDQRIDSPVGMRAGDGTGDVESDIDDDDDFWVAALGAYTTMSCGKADGNKSSPMGEGWDKKTEDEFMRDLLAHAHSPLYTSTMPKVKKTNRFIWRKKGPGNTNANIRDSSNPTRIDSAAAVDMPNNPDTDKDKNATLEPFAWSVTFDRSGIAASMPYPVKARDACMTLFAPGDHTKSAVTHHAPKEPYARSNIQHSKWPWPISNSLPKDRVLRRSSDSSWKTTSSDQSEAIDEEGAFPLSLREIQKHYDALNQAWVGGAKVIRKKVDANDNDDDLITLPSTDEMQKNYGAFCRCSMKGGGNDGVSSPLSQGKIQKNYNEFLQGGAKGGSKKVDDDQKAYEEIFLLDDSEGDFEDCDTEEDNLSMEIEGMVLGDVETDDMPME